MHTAYEITPDLSYASPAQNGDVSLFLEEGAVVSVKAILSPVQATSLRRSLGRLLDEGGLDPAGGYSIKELTELYKKLQAGGIFTHEDDDKLAKVITAYIRLIEFTNAKANEEA